MSYSNKIYRMKYPEKWNEEKKKYYRQFSGRKLNFNNRQPWTATEINIILNRIAKDRIIHKLIGRSVRAIQVKRSKIIREIRDEVSEQSMGQRDMDCKQQSILL